MGDDETEVPACAAFLLCADEGRASRVAASAAASAGRRCTGCTPGRRAPASVHPPVTPGFLLLLDRRLRYRALLLFPRAEPALLDLVLERLGVDLKEAGRLRAVPVHAVEDLVDGHAFGFPGGPTRDVLETDHLLGVDGRRHRRGGHGWPRAAA